MPETVDGLERGEFEDHQAPAVVRTFEHLDRDPAGNKISSPELRRERPDRVAIRDEGFPAGEKFNLDHEIGWHSLLPGVVGAAATDPSNGQENPNPRISRADALRGKLDVGKPAIAMAAQKPLAAKLAAECRGRPGRSS
jgi:hypothetical protein